MKKLFKNFDKEKFASFVNWAKLIIPILTILILCMPVIRFNNNKELTINNKTESQHQSFTVTGFQMIGAMGADDKTDSSVNVAYLGDIIEADKDNDYKNYDGGQTIVFTGVLCLMVFLCSIFLLAINIITKIAKNDTVKKIAILCEPYTAFALGLFTFLYFLFSLFTTTFRYSATIPNNTFKENMSSVFTFWGFVMIVICLAYAGYEINSYVKAIKAKKLALADTKPATAEEVIEIKTEETKPEA